MAIQIQSLKKISEGYKEKTYIYKDLHLDFATASQYNTPLDRQIRSNDVKLSYDLEAIKNSIRNLFNTRPGQRFLFPLYGLDLHIFLFEQITDENARTLGETIVSGLERFEKRIIVQNCIVTPNNDDNEYEIDVIYTVPRLNAKDSISTILNAKTRSFSSNSTNALQL